MTLSPLMIYLIGICDNLIFLSGLILAVFIILFLYLPMILELIDEFPFEIKPITAIKTIIGGLIVSALLCIFIPDSKTLTAMYVLPPIVNSESVQQLPTDIIDFVRDYLKEQKE